MHFIFPWSGSGGAIWDLSSGGYILGFVAAAYLVGKLAEKGWDRNSRIPLAMLIGNVSIYVFGLVWLGLLLVSAFAPLFVCGAFRAPVGKQGTHKASSFACLQWRGASGALLLEPEPWAWPEPEQESRV